MNKLHKLHNDCANFSPFGKPAIFCLCKQGKSCRPAASVFIAALFASLIAVLSVIPYAEGAVQGAENAGAGNSAENTENIKTGWDMPISGLSDLSGIQDIPDIPDIPGVPPFPMVLYGQITVNGTPAPSGTIIDSRINNVSRGSHTTLIAGIYGAFPQDRMLITGEKADEGKSVEFYIKTPFMSEYLKASENAGFYSGKIYEFNLSAASDGTPPDTDVNLEMLSGIALTGKGGDISNPDSTTIIDRKKYANTSEVEVAFNSTAFNPTKANSIGSAGIESCRLKNENEPWDPWFLFRENVPWELSSGDGVKTVFAQCKNSTGAVSAEVNASIILDTISPDTAILSGPDEINLLESAAYAYGSTEQGSFFSYRLDDNAWSAWAAETSATIEPSDAGSHTFEIRSMDKAGNIDPAPANRTLLVNDDYIPEKIKIALSGYVFVYDAKARGGAEIIAKIEGAERGRITTSIDGVYGENVSNASNRLIINGYKIDSNKAVSFFVKPSGGREFIRAKESLIFDESKRSLRLDLHAGNNTPPVLLKIPNRTISASELFGQIDIYSYASDSESADSELAYGISQTNPAIINCFVSANRYISCAPPNNIGGSSIITLSAQDPAGLSASEEFEITVAEMPSPPPAVSSLPLSAFGSAALNGAPMPSGTEIIAKINGQERGRITSSKPGAYGENPYSRLIITGYGGEENSEIRFFAKIASNGGNSGDRGNSSYKYVEANETAKWAAAGILNLNLTFQEVVPQDLFYRNAGLSGLSVEGNLIEGEQVSVKSKLANSGAFDESRITVAFFADGKQAAVEEYALPSKEAKDISFLWAAVLGTHELSMQVRMADDEDPKDNALSKNITIGPKTDSGSGGNAQATGGGGGGGSGKSAKSAIFVSESRASKLHLNLKTELSGASAEIGELSDAPLSEGISAPMNPVYKYLNITKINFKDSDIENASIEFSVDKTWLASNNIAEIYLARHENGWNRLSTELVNSTGSGNIYRAHTPGFSYFAVVGVQSAPNSQNAQNAPAPNVPSLPDTVYKNSKNSNSGGNSGNQNNPDDNSTANGASGGSQSGNSAPVTGYSTFFSAGAGTYMMYGAAIFLIILAAFLFSYRGSRRI